MKRYKVTYRYRKDGSAGIYKTDMMYVSSAEFAIPTCIGIYQARGEVSVGVSITIYLFYR